ncbi:MAG: glycosyltransferase family 39 protein [Anaerolineae bacterium]
MRVGRRGGAAWALVAIIALAVALRVGSALLQGEAVVPLPGIYDQVSYDTLARQVLAGRGFRFDTEWWPVTRAGEPTAHWSYLYTMFLTLVYGVFGLHPTVARLIQAVLAGIAMPWLVYRLGRRAFGTTAGLVAAALAAVYAYFVYYAGALMTETFYIVAILWALDLAMGIGMGRAAPQTDRGDAPRNDRTRLWEWALLGLALGIAVLLRQLFLFFVPFLFGWIAWARWQRVQRDEGQSIETRRGVETRHGASLQDVVGVRYWLISLAVIGVMIAPWTVRNYMAFHRVVLLNTNAGYAFFWANHPIYGTHFVGILPSGGPSYQELIPQELRGLDEAALDQALMGRAVGFIAADPGRYALLSLSRMPEYFKFWPSEDSGTVSNLARTLSFGVLLPFMIYGVCLALWRRKSLARAGRWPAVTLLYLYMGVYTLIHLLSWALIRYRLPVDAALMLFAGYGMIDLWQRVFMRTLTPGPSPTRREGGRTKNLGVDGNAD